MQILSFLFLFLSFSPSYPENSIEQPCLSGEEIKLFKLINSYRETRGLKAIPFSSSMTMVAQAHARDLVKNYVYKNGAKCNPHSWSSDGPWSDCFYTADHKKAQCMWDKPKEIAGYNEYGYEILFDSSDGASAGEALIGWQKSPAHHAVMINSGIWEKIEWGAMGVGIYGEYATAWFGESEEQPPLNEPTLCE